MHPTLYVTIGRMYVRILRCSLKVETCLTCTQRVSQTSETIHESNKVDKYPTSTSVIQMQRSNDIVTHWRMLQKRPKGLACILLNRELCTINTWIFQQYFIFIFRAPLQHVYQFSLITEMCWLFRCCGNHIYRHHSGLSFHTNKVQINQWRI